MLKLLLITLWIAFHPVHDSMMSIDYSVENKVFKVFVRMNYADFQTDFPTLKGYMAVPDLTKENASNQNMVGEYLKQRVRILAGESDLPGELVSFTLKENELIMNLVYRLKSESSTFTVRNSILADIYKDQANLVIFSYGSYEEGIKLTPEKREHKFIVKK
jgi:hypothetical protein